MRTHTRRYSGGYSRRMIQTEACAGSTARLTTSSSSARTVSRSTASRSRAAKVADGRLRVEAGAVEAAVDEALHPDPERIE